MSEENGSQVNLSRNNIYGVEKVEAEEKKGFFARRGLPEPETVLSRASTPCSAAARKLMRIFTRNWKKS